ncbi:MAG: stage III sporulation protein AB [Bacillota bacterium]
MWIRLIGSVMVLGATTMFGVHFQQIEVVRKKELLELERGILLLKQQLNCFGMPLEEAFLAVGEKISGTASLIFLEVAEAIKERQAGSVSEIFHEVLERKKESGLQESDFLALRDFGKTIVAFARKENTGSIDFLLEYIKKEIGGLEKRIEKNGKLYMSVGVLSGLLLVVMLW